MGGPKRKQMQSAADASPEVDSDGSLRQQREMIVDTLEQVRSDYSLARKQLEDVHHFFVERERAAGEHLLWMMNAATRVQPGTADRSTLSEDEGSAAEDSDHTHVLFLKAYCFGNFEVHLNGKRLDKWASLKAKSLLKILISHHRKPIIKDVLVEMLWPNCDPAAGYHNLKSAACALRHVLRRGEPSDDGETHCPFVLFSEARYMLSPKLELWVDVDEFERTWMTGQRLEKQCDIEGAVKQYQLAHDLYQGDYLEDEPYADWALLRREALKDIYLTILGKLASIAFAADDYRNCISYSQKMLDKDCCDEEAYRWLIRSHVCLGQRHRAQQWYSLCVATLKREMDSLPDHRTLSLYHKLLH